jgi:hypothetical protein
MKRKDLALLPLRILALTVVMMVLNGIGSTFLPTNPDPIAGATEPTAAATPEGSFMALVFAIMLLQTIALAYPIVRSKWHGWKLALGIFVVYFGSVTFVSQMESLVYLEGKMPDGMVRGLFAMGAVAAALFSPIAVLVLGKWKRPAIETEISHRYEPRSAGEWAWKIALGGFIFLSLYYLFGYFVAWQIPALRDYYGGTDPGSFFAQMQNVAQGAPWMLPYQYLRSLTMVGLALLVIRMMKGAWWEAGLATSIVFAVPILYLLLPNDMMPETVRMGHLIETLPYQFLFGWIAAWLFCRLGAGKLSAET